MYFLFFSRWRNDWKPSFRFYGRLTKTTPHYLYVDMRVVSCNPSRLIKSTFFYMIFQSHKFHFLLFISFFHFYRLYLEKRKNTFKNDISVHQKNLENLISVLETLLEDSMAFKSRKMGNELQLLTKRFTTLP